MGWLITLAIIFLLAILPLGFRAVYRDKNPGLWLLLGPIKLQILPAKPKDKPKKEAKKKSSKSDGTKAGGKKKESSKGGSYRDFLPIVQTVLEFLGHFRRKIRVNHLEMQLTLAGGDPSNLAVNYGKAWAALGNLLPLLEQVFVIKKRNLDIACDFVGIETLVFARMDVTITLGRVLHLLTRHGIKILIQLLQLKKLRKGGAEK